MHVHVPTSCAHMFQSAQILCDDGASYPDLVEITSKLHAVESIEVHYQLHSIALKQLLQFSPQWGHHTDKDADEVEVASSVAEALVELKSLPLCRKSYPALWGWTKALCREGTAGGPTLDVGGRAEGILDVGGVKPVQRDLVDIAGEERMDVNTYETPPSLMGSQAPPTLVTPQTPLQAPPSLVTIQAPPPPISPLPVPPPPAPPKAPPLPVPPKAPSPSVPPYVSLLQLCLYGVAVCAVRYPTFYKPLYRMAASLHAMGLSRVSLHAMGLSRVSLHAMGLSRVSLHAMGLSRVSLHAMGLSRVSLHAMGLSRVSLHAMGLSRVSLHAMGLSRVSIHDMGLSKVRVVRCNHCLP